MARTPECCDFWATSWPLCESRRPTTFRSLDFATYNRHVCGVLPSDVFCSGIHAAAVCGATLERHRNRDYRCSSDDVDGSTASLDRNCRPSRDDLGDHTLCGRVAS